MNTISGASRHVNDDWYGEIYLQVCSFDTNEPAHTSMTGVSSYDLCVMMYFEDYDEGMCIHIVKSTERGRITYISDDACRLCDENDEVTANVTAWVKYEGEWMSTIISLCSRCVRRTWSIVDDNVFENEKVSEDIVSGII